MKNNLQIKPEDIQSETTSLTRSTKQASRPDQKMELDIERSGLFHALGDAETAIRDELAALEAAQSPRDKSRCQCLLAYTLARTEQTEKALLIALQTAEEDPDYHESHYCVGVIAHHHLAVKSIRKAIARSPASGVDLHLQPGRSLRYLSPQDSVDILLEFSSHHPNDPDGFHAVANSVALLHEEPEYRERAIDFYEKALKLEESLWCNK